MKKTELTTNSDFITSQSSYLSNLLGPAKKIEIKHLTGWHINAIIKCLDCKTLSIRRSDLPFLASPTEIKLSEMKRSSS